MAYAWNMETAFESVDVALRNGRSVTIRTIAPSDEAALLAAFERLGPQARYWRFMRAMGEPDRKRLRAALASIAERGLAIAAVGDEGIVGTAMFVGEADPASCEFAISVTDAWAGTGLGSALLRTLVEAARNRGMRHMEGVVLAGNAAMLRLASRMGFTVTRHPDDFSLRLCRLSFEPGPETAT
jgi:GNAT superfamily N-acetyltransferase